jgi:hypothetical protein
VFCLKKFDLRRLWWLLSLLLLSAPLVIDLLLPHAPDCVIKSTLGFRCPGCGLGRSLAALFALDFGASVALYPPLLLLVPAYVLGCYLALCRAFEKPSAVWLARIWQIIGMGAALLIVVYWSSSLFFR